MNASVPVKTKIFLVFFFNLKQMRSDLDQREPKVKRVLETGNEMLKAASGGLSNATHLAQSIININTKWNDLNNRVDAKKKQFAQLNDYLNELRRN